MEDVCVSGAALKQAADLLRANKKIQAIKVVRLDSGCSLKAAKHAVENYMDSLGMVPDSAYKRQSWKNSEARLRPRCFVRSVDLAVGDGTVTVDLEEAKFRVSAAMGDVGLMVGIEVDYPEEPQPAFVDVETDTGWLFHAICTSHLRRIVR